MLLTFPGAAIAATPDSNLSSPEGILRFAQQSVHPLAQYGEMPSVQSLLAADLGDLVDAVHDHYPGGMRQLADDLGLVLNDGWLVGNFLALMRIGHVLHIHPPGMSQPVVVRLDTTDERHPVLQAEQLPSPGKDTCAFAGSRAGFNALLRILRDNIGRVVDFRDDVHVFGGRMQRVA